MPTNKVASEPKNSLIASSNYLIFIGNDNANQAMGNDGR